MRRYEEEANKISGQISGYSYGDGRITNVILENDSTYSSPGVSLPVGTSCLVHIWGKNMTPNAEQLGILWVITDPDNIKVERYETWEAWPYTGAGKEHEFIGGRFNLTKPGQYLLAANLLMNKSAPTIVYGWGGVLCTAQPIETIAFSLTRPTASPYQAYPGETVTITCPVKSNCTSAQSVTAKFNIYEGSALAGHGTLLATKSKSFSISPGATYNASVSATAIAGTIDRRDVEVEIYVGGQLIKESEWDDVYYVIEEQLAFSLSRPTTNPSEGIHPGDTVTITCAVKSNCTKAQSVRASFKIYEGSALSGHGTLLATKDTSFSISPGATYSASVNKVAEAGSIDRRDVKVEIYVGGVLVTESEWDDVYYVEEVPGEEGEFSGLITQITPSQIKTGQPIDIYVSFNAYSDSLFQQINGWWTKAVATADGLSDEDAQFHIGRDGSRTNQSLHLGTMPARNISGTLVLKAHVGGVLPTTPSEDGEWIILDTKSFAISFLPSNGEEPPIECTTDEQCPIGYVCVNGVCVPEEEAECAVDADCPPGYKCVNGICVPEEEAGEFPWALVAAGGLGLVALILLAKPEVPPARKPPGKKKAKKP